jgi:hypothetical protein
MSEKSGWVGATGTYYDPVGDLDGSQGPHVSFRVARHVESEDYAWRKVDLPVSLLPRFYWAALHSWEVDISTLRQELADLGCNWLDLVGPERHDEALIVHRVGARDAMQIVAADLGDLLDALSTPAVD